MLTTAVRHDQPATPEQIAVHYAQLAMMFPQANARAQTADDQKRAELQASMKFKLFCNDLAGIPDRALAKACARYRTTPSADGRQKFFPQPWQLIELCAAEMRAVKLRERTIPRMLEVLDGKSDAAAAPPQNAPHRPFTAAEVLAAHGKTWPPKKAPVTTTEPETSKPISTGRPETSESAADLRQRIEARLRALGKRTGEAA